MTETPSPSPYELAKQAAAVLAEKTGIERHDVALVLGSGWLPAVDALGEATAEIATTDLPGFAPAAVAGHSGKIRSIRSGDKQLLVFLSRTHYYEGKGVAAVVHGVRTAAQAGCRAIVLTNGCGGLKETWTPGTPVLISDHINLTGRSPIEGANFVDLTDLYSSRLRAMCREVDPSLDEGVYVQFPGPHYETPAEIGMVRAIGGHLAGMSTTLEAIAAREAGMEVLGISLVTNLAAGFSGEPLNHDGGPRGRPGGRLADGRAARPDRAPHLSSELRVLEVEPPGEQRQRPGRLTPDGRLLVVEQVADDVDVLGVADRAEGAQRLHAHPGQLTLDGQHCGARPGLADLALGRDLQAHLARSPVLVVEPGDHRRGGRVVPDVEQPPGAPRAHPVVLPVLRVRCRRSLLEHQPGEVRHHLGVRFPVTVAQQLDAELDHGRLTEVAGELQHQVADGCLEVARWWQLGHVVIMQRTSPTNLRP